jgi:Zn-dependent peptidase ImmA (M78 family)
MLKKYPKINNLHKLTKEDIENETIAKLNQYCPECISVVQRVPIEEIIEKEGICISPQKLSADKSILGAFVFNKGQVKTFENGKENYKNYQAKTIIIDSDIYDAEEARLRFTEGHELGHYECQYDLFHVNENQLSLNLFEEKEEVATLCKREAFEVFTTTKCDNFDLKEWQANYYSSCILMPKPALMNELKEYIKNYDYLDNNSKLLDELSESEFEYLFKKLCNKFDVSKESMKNRMISLNLCSPRKFLQL